MARRAAEASIHSPLSSSPPPLRTRRWALPLPPKPRCTWLLRRPRCVLPLLATLPLATRAWRSLQPKSHPRCAPWADLWPWSWMTRCLATRTCRTAGSGATCSTMYAGEVRGCWSYLTMRAPVRCPACCLCAGGEHSHFCVRKRGCGEFVCFDSHAEAAFRRALAMASSPMLLLRRLKTLAPSTW